MTRFKFSNSKRVMLIEFVFIRNAGWSEWKSVTGCSTRSETRGIRSSFFTSITYTAYTDRQFVRTVILFPFPRLIIFEKKGKKKKGKIPFHTLRDMTREVAKKRVSFII